jgi:glycosyltransferase involved in cell wall biosynthesis
MWNISKKDIQSLVLERIIRLEVPYGGQLPSSAQASYSVSHVTFSTLGGAGSVAKRLQGGQLRDGTPSQLLTITNSNIRGLLTKNPVLVAEALLDFFVVRKTTSSQLFTLFRKSENTRIANLVKNSDDLIHLHWTPGVLSLETISLLARSGRGCVWTLHDMWPFTGGCHHAEDCRGFTSGCKECPQVRDKFRSRTERVYVEKLEALRKEPLASIVSPSRWLAEQAEQSEIFSNLKIKIIPNPVDCEVFSPGDMKSAREVFGISNDAFVVGCSAANLSDPMKNVKAIVDGVVELKKQFPQNEIQILAVGEGDFKSENIRVQTTGLINTSSRMVSAYRAMNVFVSMSLAENFPMTLVEAAAVGVPIICSATGGMPEIVVNGVTGRVLNSPAQLTNAIAQLLLDSDVRVAMSLEARSMALGRFELFKIVKDYSDVYREQIGNNTDYRGRNIT